MKSAKASPLLNFEFSDKLTATFRTFVTPTQANDTVHHIQTALRETLRTHVCGHATSSGKHRKLTSKNSKETMEVNDDDIPVSVVCVNLVTKLAGIILPHSLSHIGKSENILTIMKPVDELMAHCIETSLGSSLFPPSKLKGKRSRQSDVDAIWTRNCLVMSLLGLWNDLSERIILDNMERSSILEETTSRVSTTKDTITQLLNRSSLGDLHLEVVRYLYCSSVFLLSLIGSKRC
jgi:hypothetical protein